MVFSKSIINILNVIYIFFKGLYDKLKSVCLFIITFLNKVYITIKDFFYSDMFYFNFNKYKFLAFNIIRVFYIKSFLVNKLYKLGLSYKIGVIRLKISNKKNEFINKNIRLLISYEYIKVYIKDIIKLLYIPLAIYTLFRVLDMALVHFYEYSPLNDIEGLCPNKDAQQSLLLTLSTIIATLIGLYFTALAILSQTVLNKIRPDINEFLKLNKRGTSYIIIIVIILAILLLLSFNMSVGKTIHNNFMLIILITSAFVIIMFWNVATSVFSYFNPEVLVKKVKEETLFDLNLLKNKFINNNALAHEVIRDRVFNKLERYSDIINYVESMPNTSASSNSLYNISIDLLDILYKYTEMKTLIPYDSLFFIKKNYFKRYYESSETDILAIKNHDLIGFIGAKEGYDKTWFEGHFTKLINRVIVNLYREDTIDICKKTLSLYLENLDNLFNKGFIDIETYIKFAEDVHINVISPDNTKYNDDYSKVHLLLNTICFKVFNNLLKCNDIAEKGINYIMPSKTEIKDLKFKNRFYIWLYEFLPFYSKKLNLEYLLESRFYASNNYIEEELKELYMKESSTYIYPYLLKCIELCESVSKKEYSSNNLHLYYYIYEFAVRMELRENIDYLKKVLDDKYGIIDVSLNQLPEIKERVLLLISQTDIDCDGNNHDYQGFAYHKLYEKCYKALEFNDMLKLKIYYNSYYRLNKSYINNIQKDKNIKNKDFRNSYVVSLEKDLILLTGAIYLYNIDRKEDLSWLDSYWKSLTYNNVMSYILMMDIQDYPLRNNLDIERLNLLDSIEIISTEDEILKEIIRRNSHNRNLLIYIVYIIYGYFNNYHKAEDYKDVQKIIIDNIIKGLKIYPSISSVLSPNGEF